MAADGSGPEIGYTGARFGGASRRKPRKRAGRSGRPDPDAVTEVIAAVPPDLPPPEPPGTPPSPPAGSPDEPDVGSTGARFGGRWRRRAAGTASTDEPAPAVPAAASDPPPPVPPLSLPGLDHHEDSSSSSIVRPYVFTGGRTRSRFELSIEALVSAVPAAATGDLGNEHHAVVALCREAHSVAEIAALLGVPLGVARVLVGDLAAAGAVALHRTVDAGGPDLALMERVLAGLRRL